jgi:exonuclease 3'-5' domain-containing protein 2
VSSRTPTRWGALCADFLTDSASDAYACLQLYHVLEKERLSLEPSPPRPYHAELNNPLEVAFAVDDEDVANDDALESVDQSVDESSVVTVVKSSQQRTPKAGPAPPKTPKSASSRPSPKSKPSTPVATWVDQRVAAAELQMQTYRAAKRAKGAEVRAPPSMLRAYYVWHSNTDLKPGDIAKLLRDPPLLTHTVTGYILDAIANEHLSYDKQRMTSEILSVLSPNALTVARYQSIVRECRYPATPTTAPPQST